MRTTHSRPAQRTRIYLPRPLIIPTYEPNRSAALRNRPRLSLDWTRSTVCDPSLARSRAGKPRHLCKDSHSLTCFSICCSGSLLRRLVVTHRAGLVIVRHIPESRTSHQPRRRLRRVAIARCSPVRVNISISPRANLGVMSERHGTGASLRL